MPLRYETLITPEGLATDLAYAAEPNAELTAKRMLKLRQKALKLAVGGKLGFDHHRAIDAIVESKKAGILQPDTLHRVTDAPCHVVFEGAIVREVFGYDPEVRSSQLMYPVAGTWEEIAGPDMRGVLAVIAYPSLGLV